MPFNYQPIKAVLADPNADLAATKAALADLVDRVEQLEQYFDDLFQRYNKHYHHFDVIDANGNQAAISQTTAVSIQGQQVLASPAPLQPNSAVRISRARL